MAIVGGGLENVATHRTVNGAVAIQYSSIVILIPNNPNKCAL